MENGLGLSEKQNLKLRWVMQVRVAAGYHEPLANGRISVSLTMIDQLHQIAEELGGRCLSTSGKTTNAILWWGCDQGHRWEADPSDV
jgi:hypothetical protein